MDQTLSLSGLAFGEGGLKPVWQDASSIKAGHRELIHSVGALYAHALAMGHEAQSRYREFAEQMAVRGNDTLAELFDRLADFETEHAFHLAKRSIGVPIPAVPVSAYGWLNVATPVPEAHAFVLRMMTPKMALEIALQAEQQGKAFFERVRTESQHADVRKLAAELASDEAAHLAWVEDALAHLPGSNGWDRAGDPTIEQQL